MVRIMMNGLLVIAGAVTMSASAQDLRNSRNTPEGPWRLCTGPKPRPASYCVVAKSSEVSCTYREGGTDPTRQDACNAAHNAENAPYCTGQLFGCNLPK